jgi:hypothetical protein
MHAPLNHLSVSGWLSVFVLAGQIQAAHPEDDSEPQLRRNPTISNDNSTRRASPLEAPLVAYHPFKSAVGSTAIPTRAPNDAEALPLERRGKDILHSEEPMEPGRREYLWEPYLYRDAPTARERATPNINTPGADTANFPNSAFTLPEGRFYFENSPLGYYGGSTAVLAQYNWELFYRYGVTDNLEFRLYTSGFTVLDSRPTVAGFSPITFDLKYHLWDENPAYAIPAVGAEVYVQTTWGTASLNGGTQTAFSVNLDHTLPFGFSLEWNIGATQIFAQDGVNAVEENAAWSLQRDIAQDLAVFIHGYHNSASLPRGSAGRLNPSTGYHRINGRVYGAGAIWTVNQGMQVFGSLNAGTDTAPSWIALAGFAWAF